MKMLRKCDDVGNLEEKMSNACENEYMRALTQTRESTFHGLMIFRHLFTYAQMKFYFRRSKPR